MKKVSITAPNALYEDALNGFAALGWNEQSGVTREKWLEQKVLDYVLDVGRSNAINTALSQAAQQITAVADERVALARSVVVVHTEDLGPDPTEAGS